MTNKIENYFFKKNFIDIFNKERSIFINSIFDNCDIGLPNNIEDLPIIKNIEFNECVFLFCTFGPIILDNIKFKNIRFENYGIFWSPFLKNVIIDGKISSFRINKNIFLSDKNPELQKKANEFRQHFYKKIDWAIDISRAKFSNFDYSGIPGELFIRDPENQILIKKDKFFSLSLLDDKFKEKFDYVTMCLENFLDSDDYDIVIPVPLSKPKKIRQPILEGLLELRKQGFAEDN
ncbi:hypothetical protein SAMN05660772_02776 [Pasteurella testudinis DSM 23072]|uniref:Pentapeptide repeat-containing protein n=1 Tax=Pasteurella testudinis DSM 23072 TaxID=1122938 RepID=A0A1W1V3S2_9PAST|nr:hypothetical protein [Pasteurella testudinis]SMB87936.1 hypothetical protein SAMN05660772_02776 [Pasteurella testudinis DSM 23072]SUB52188.1 Uncharacterised protein [Pasteurella testudinis]